MRISTIMISTLSLTTALLAGCVTGEDPVAEENNSNAIIGGTVDTSDPQVVMVRSVTQVDAYGNPSLIIGCTATLISPTVLLSAGHCLAQGALWTDILQGPSPNIFQPTTWSTIYASVIPSPLYDGDASKGHDVAVVVMTSPLPYIPAGRGPTPAVGTPVTSIGYGVDSFSQTGFGTKRRLDNTVSAVNGATFAAGYEGHNVCHGDSGGPTIQGGRVVGVNDFVDTADCHGGGHFARIDTNLDFIHWYVPGF